MLTVIVPILLLAGSPGARAPTNPFADCVGLDHQDIPGKTIVCPELHALIGREGFREAAIGEAEEQLTILRSELEAIAPGAFVKLSGLLPGDTEDRKIEPRPGKTPSWRVKNYSRMGGSQAIIAVVPAKNSRFATVTCTVERDKPLEACEKFIRAVSGRIPDIEWPAPPSDPAEPMPRLEPEPVFRGKPVQLNHPAGRTCVAMTMGSAQSFSCFAPDTFSSTHAELRWYVDPAKNPDGVVAVARRAIEKEYAEPLEELRGPAPKPPDRSSVFRCKVDGVAAECVRYSLRKVFSRKDIKTLNGLAAYAQLDGKWTAAVCESVEKGKDGALPYPCGVALSEAPLTRRKVPE